MDKVVRDGKVAVLVSPGFGAGWSTWNSGKEAKIMTFHPKFVEWVENGKKTPIEPVTEEVFGQDEYICDLGAEDLEIVWIDEGQPFVITDYDGNESINYPESQSWMIA